MKTGEELSLDAIKAVHKALEEFPDFIFFCIRKDSDEGFCYGHVADDRRSFILDAQIVHTLVHQPRVLEQFKSLIASAEQLLKDKQYKPEKPN